MNSKNNDETQNNNELVKRDDLTHKDSSEKEKNKKDESTQKKSKENEEKIKPDNNILNLDEEKEENNEKEKIIKTKEKEKDIEKNHQKKSQRNQVSIKDWSCRTLKEYEIINDPVGSGSYGTVYKAYYKGSPEYGNKYGIPKIVALKQIKTSEEKEGFPITALREIMIMKRLQHKNILQLLEVIVSSNAKNELTEAKERDVYLVFNYMEHDLCTIIFNNIKYELSHIKYIFHELLLGIKYLHDNDVLHRDLKPSNILLNNKGEIKIGDFGLARIFGKIDIKKYTNNVVTVCYRAPELLLGEKNYSTEIDVWSLGCILLELFTRKMTFRSDKEKDVFALICQKCGTPDEISWPGVTKLENYSKIIPETKYENKLEKEYPNIDEVTMDLIKKMLTLNPKERIKIDEILKHPYLTTHEPKMCKAEDMPKIEEEMHYLRFQKKMEKKRQEQKLGKGDYGRQKSFLGNKRKK